MDEHGKENIKNSIMDLFVSKNADKKPQEVSPEEYKRRMENVRNKDRQLAQESAERD